MVSEWPEVELQTLVSKLGDGLHGTPVYAEGGDFYFINGSNLQDGRIRLPAQTKRIPVNEYERHKTPLGQNTLLVSINGTLGNVAYYSGEPVVLSKSVCYLNLLDGVDRVFIRHILSGPLFIHYIQTQSTGTTIKNVSLKMMREFRLRLPSLDEQRRIAAVLGALDDKIELNRKMNRTLEDMAQALFKSWFIDFDGHDDLVDSELGPIPRGWKVSTVGQEFQLTMGQSPPGSTYNESGAGLPLYQGATDFGFRFPTPRVFCSAPTRLANAGDTLVSVRAPVGTTNMASEICCVGRGVAALRHISGSASYTYSVARNLSTSFDVFNAEGTVFGSINKSDFGKLAVVAPPAESVAMFTGSVGALDNRIGLNERQSRTLTTLRDTLLPKLISGELRVPEAEHVVEEALS